MPFFTKTHIYKKITSLGLCAILIYNTTVPAFGQEFLYNGHSVDAKELPNKKDLIKNLDFEKMVMEKNQERFVMSSIQPSPDSMGSFLSKMPKDMYMKIFALKSSSEKYFAESDPIYAKALQVKYEILGNPNEQMAKNASKFFEEGDAALRQDEAEKEQIKFYREEIEKEADQVRSEIESSYQETLVNLEKTVIQLLEENEYDEDVIIKWKEDNLERLARHHTEALKDLDNYKNQQIKEAEKVVAETKQEITNDPDIFFNHIKPLFKEMMALYEQGPASVTPHIIEITPLVVSLLNSNGEHIYNKEDVKKLLKIYESFIESEKEKGLSGKNTLPSHFCRAKGVCEPLINAFIGVSSLISSGAASGADHQLGQLIFDTMNAYHGTAGTIPVVASGFSALLIMKEYNFVDDFLKYRVSEENGFKSSEILDYISVAKITDVISNASGKYLGRSSEFGKYEIEDGITHNLYSDLAQILAEDGTPDALNILRKYGVERCFVTATSGVQANTMSKYSISCEGIKPFILGALMSGKSGANKYKLSGDTDKIKKANADWHNLAKAYFYGDADAMIALQLMSYSMGDLKPTEELSFDTMLYNTYKNHIPEQLLSANNIIIDTKRKENKENRYLAWQITMIPAFFADMIWTMWGITSLPKIASSLLSFGRTVFNVFKLAKLGVTAKGIMGIGQFTHNVFKIQAMMIKTKLAPKIAKIRSFVHDYKISSGEIIAFNAAKYTNAVDTHISNVVATARKGADVTQNITKLAGLLEYDSSISAFKFVDGIEKMGYNKQLQGIMKQIFDSALIETKNEMRLEKFFHRTSNHEMLFLNQMEIAVRQSHLGGMDKERLIRFFMSKKFDPVAQKAVLNMESILKSSSRNFAKEPLLLKTFVGTEKGKGSLDVELSLTDNMPVFSEKVPHSAAIIQNGDDSFLLKFLKGVNETIDFSAFKLAFGNNESFINFVRLAANKGPKAVIELKFLPKEGNTFWYKNIKSAFIHNKENLLSGKGKVIFTDGLKQYETGITLRTYKKYDGVKIFVHDNLVEGGAIIPIKEGQDLAVTLKGSFFLPKYQLGNFVNMVDGAKFAKPLNISLLNGKNKINALFVSQSISFTAALTGFISPLGKNYPELKTEQIAVIAIVLPYLFSALTPFVSPLVKRYGAARVLKTSMALSMGSLIPPMIGGFTGLKGIQADNPFLDKKPDPRWLYPSALMIGIASTLTRGSFSPLIQSIGGGSGTLKSVAFKSISSFLFVIPPMIGVAFDKWTPRYFTYDDGSYYYKNPAKQIKVQKKWFDFSFSYPVMFAVAGMALYTLQRSQFNVRIGTEKGYKIGSFGNFFKEAGSSYKVLLSKKMLPLTISGSLLSGAEASFLYSYATSKSSEYVRNKIHEETVVPFIALLGINVPAFIARFNSKSYLKLVGGDNILGYRNMMTVSLSLSGMGAYLMMKNDDPLSFIGATALCAVGFSQMTSSILRYGHVKLAKELQMPTKIVTSWDVSYPTIFIGMSGVSYMFGAASDNKIKGINLEDKNSQISLKNTASKQTLYVPFGALALGAGLTYKGMTSFRLLSGSGRVLAPLGLIGESQNPYFKKLVMPKPQMQSNFTEPKPLIRARKFPQQFPMPNFSLKPLPAK